MKKNRVRLTESQLHQVIIESVKSVLKENMFGTNNSKKHRKEAQIMALKQYFSAMDDISKGIEKIREFGNWNNPRINLDYARKWDNRLVEIEKEIHDLALSMSMNYDNQELNYVVRNRKTSIYVDQDELNAKLFNPYTQKYETMNVTKVAMILNKLFKETDENLEAMGGYRYKNGEIGFGEYSCRMDYVKRYGPVRALELITREHEEEPGNWYERNEHGDFDNY